MKFGLCFVNYNNCQHSINLLDSIINADSFVGKVIIVDNNSSKIDYQKIKLYSSKFDFVKIIRLNRNIGYFRALNIGLTYLSKKSNYDFYIVGNNDLIFPNDIFLKLHNKSNFLKDKFIISPDIITDDGYHQNPHVINSITKKREFVYDLYYSNFYLSRLIYFTASLFSKYTMRGDELKFNNEMYIYQGYGACYIITDKFIRTYHLLPQDTFLMYEEFFLAKLLNDDGEKIYYYPHITVIHNAHATTKSLPSKSKWLLAKESHKLYRKYIHIWH